MFHLNYISTRSAGIYPRNSVLLCQAQNSVIIHILFSFWGQRRKEAAAKYWRIQPGYWKYETRNEQRIHGVPFLLSHPNPGQQCTVKTKFHQQLMLKTTHLCDLQTISSSLWRFSKQQILWLGFDCCESVYCFSKKFFFFLQLDHCSLQQLGKKECCLKKIRTLYSLVPAGTRTLRRTEADIHSTTVRKI